MRIYTYYNQFHDGNIDIGLQGQLIDLWKISWSRKGYEPIVLGPEDARKHVYYNKFNNNIQKVYRKLMGSHPTEYGMSCWYRWLAYATQADEKFYVSDYDAINVNFPITEPNDKLHFMDASCPFFASGTPKQFEDLCKIFVTLGDEQFGKLKRAAPGFTWYHDQEFFVVFQNLLSSEYDILFTRKRDTIGGEYDPHPAKVKKSVYNPDRPIELKDYGVVHISHHNAGWVWDTYPKFAAKHKNIDAVRIAMTRELINNL